MDPRSGRRRTFAWCLLALAAALLPALAARRGAAPGPLSARLFGVTESALAFEPQVADFGTAFTGEEVTCSFAFRNGSDRPVRILEAAGTCGCLQARPSARWIAPRAAGSLRVTLITDGRYGPQAFRLRVRTDEGERSGVLLGVRGTLRTALRPRPPRWSVAEAKPGTLLEQDFRIELLEPIEALQIRARGPELEVESREGPGGALRLRVRVRVPATVGTRLHGVELRYRHAQSGRALATWIPCVWNVPAPLIVEPAEAELSGGRARLLVRARWPDLARLASVETGELPLRVARTERADGMTVLELQRLEGALPAGAVLRLALDQPRFEPVEVPLFEAGP